ncbi:hypothetical protein ACE1SV_38120 [Streptomyces sp. E-15]
MPTTGGNAHMRRLRQDDPLWVGPYAVLAGVDEEAERHRTPDRRYAARSADGRRTALVYVPQPGADPARWAAEARRLVIPGLAPVAEVDRAAVPVWHAAPYTPVLP